MLVAQVLVGGHKEIKLLFRELEKIAVLVSAPAFSLRACAEMTGKVFGQRLGNTFVENDLHAARSAASERSNTRQAKSLVTEGKHSINSSKV